MAKTFHDTCLVSYMDLVLLILHNYPLLLFSSQRSALEYRFNIFLLEVLTDSKAKVDGLVPLKLEKKGPSNSKKSQDFQQEGKGEVRCRRQSAHH